MSLLEDMNDRCRDMDGPKDCYDDRREFFKQPSCSHVCDGIPFDRKVLAKFREIRKAGIDPDLLPADLKMRVMVDLPIEELRKIARRKRARKSDVEGDVNN